VLGLVEVPGEVGGRSHGGEEGCGQDHDDGRLDTVGGPPQLVPADKQPS
jgi:hypothetical protein